MWEKKRYVLLDEFEYKLLFQAMVWFRNEVIRQGIDPMDVNELLIKLTEAKSRR